MKCVVQLAETGIKSLVSLNHNPTFRDIVDQVSLSLSATLLPRPLSLLTEPSFVNHGKNFVRISLHVHSQHGVEPMYGFSQSTEACGTMWFPIQICRVVVNQSWFFRWNWKQLHLKNRNIRPKQVYISAKRTVLAKTETRKSKNTEILSRIRTEKVFSWPLIQAKHGIHAISLRHTATGHGAEQKKLGTPGDGGDGAKFHFVLIAPTHAIGVMLTQVRLHIHWWYKQVFMKSHVVLSEATFNRLQFGVIHKNVGMDISWIKYGYQIHTLSNL